jgi:hypothetical protein
MDGCFIPSSSTSSEAETVDREKREGRDSVLYVRTWLRLSHMRASSVAVPVVDTTGQETPRVDGQGMPRDSSEADRRDYDQIKLTCAIHQDITSQLTKQINATRGIGRTWMPRAAIILIFTSAGLTIRARLDPPWILLRTNQDGAAARRASRGKALVLPPTGPREERLA